MCPARLSKKPGENKAKKSKQVSQKYTASRLHEKGVLIAIEDLQPNQWVLPRAAAAQRRGATFLTGSSSSLGRFKNVIFEISPSEAVGVFDVKAKFMGVHLETLQIEYQVALLGPEIFREEVEQMTTRAGLLLSLSQDLLQLQYEGVAVMKIFDRATINVNLLIFLLNKKFYEK